ncbi:hypothetical protein [Streptomyces sp. NPDC050704]|uniref:hypothetical protein n=1 Tax=Streptomyces sp. NPDC050704 TaxID=3157219 RepID=UPI0034245FA4
MGHCRALVVGYHRDIDGGRATAGIGAFAAGAEFEAHGRAFRGRDETLQAMVLLHVRQPDGAYVLDRVLGTVHRFRHSGGEWRITHRTSRPPHPTV